MSFLKIIFVSNYFNHHQKPFCEELYQRLGNDFAFISTVVMRDERKKLGYAQDLRPVYVISTYEGTQQQQKAFALINQADIVIMGSAPEKFLRHRKKQNKLIFRYQERLLKQELNFAQKLKRMIVCRIRNPKRKKIYLLCASGYTSADYKKLDLFGNKAYKWGYFPDFKEYDITSLMVQKDKNKILWCGRFLSWKHPEYALYVASRLKNEGYDFSIDFIGTGLLEEELKNKSEEMGLKKEVAFHGGMKPEIVRRYMEKSAIFMFTSNFEEGWGAVLNEAMNSGCAVIASHAVGSAPFLLKHKENGLIFENENIEDLYCWTKYLLDHNTEQERLGANAYRTIAENWNPVVAAERFVKLVEKINECGQCDLFCDGPCSRADILEDNWFGEAE